MIESKYLKLVLFGPWIAASALFIQALYILITTAYWSKLALHPIPYWDQWQIVHFMRQRPSDNFWSLLWAQHNEHRIVIPRLIALADYAAFSGRGHLDIVFIWLMQIFSALLLISLSFDILVPKTTMRPWRVFAAGLIVSLSFAAGQMENFVWPFETSFVGMFFFSILAFFCLKQSMGSKIQGSSSLGWAVTGALAAIASFLCLASGIITMAVFLAAGKFARIRLRTFACCLFAFAVTVAAYLHGYTRPAEHGSPSQGVLHHLPFLLWYAVVYLGNIFAKPVPWPSFGAMPRPPGNASALALATLVGLVGLTLFLQAAGSFIRLNFERRYVSDGVVHSATDNELKPSPRFFAAFLALLCIAVVEIGQALLTAMGRYNFGLPQALSSRYLTPVSFFWSILLVLGLGLALLKKDPVRVAIVSILALVAVGQIAAQQNKIGALFAAHTVPMELAANALRVGVQDRDAFLLVYPSPEFVNDLRPFLVQNRKSIFSGYPYSVLGQNLNQVLKLSPQALCRGHFDGISSDGLQRGAKVFGSAWSVEESRVPQHIFLTDEAGTIIGLASAGLEHSDLVARKNLVVDAQNGWEGYSKTGHAVSAYAVVESEHAACLLDGSFEIAPNN